MRTQKMPINPMSAGPIDKKISSRSSLAKHMPNQNKRGRCQSAHRMQRISIIPEKKTPKMNPRNECGRV